MRVAFAGCIFDSGRRELIRDGTLVHLSPKAFELLRALLERRPHAVPRAELRDLLWPDVIVGHTSLGRTLVEVRAAIGDDARQPRLVRTVHRFGYAFAAPAVEVADAPAGTQPSRFRLVWGPREIELATGDNVLGRAPGCSACIDAPAVSRRHAVVAVTESGATLEDLGSKNGTFLRGRRVTAPEPLADKDEISLGAVRSFGSVLMTVRVFTEPPSTRSQHSGEEDGSSQRR
jgi:DNA-binding winged helix-turn-helix (wHTH) protein